MNHPIMFFDRDNKTKLVSASFFDFLDFLETILDYKVLMNRSKSLVCYLVRVAEN